MEIQPWLYRITAYPGESLSHYLGRFRRENNLTVSALGEVTGLGGTFIKRLEYFRHNPFPTAEQIEKLATFAGVKPEELWRLLPSPHIGMKLEPMRLCAACYTEVPYHRLEWQYKQTSGCERHRLRLLSECPKCRKKFDIPAIWNGQCRCGVTYESMRKFQKSF